MRGFHVFQGHRVQHNVVRGRRRAVSGITRTLRWMKSKRSRCG
jgi:hypothetical protein